MPEPLTIEKLTVKAGDALLLKDISAALAPGQITAVVGPNGAGKSTLLTAIAGLIPSHGSINIGETDLRALKPIDRARRLAYLPQIHELAWNISVADMVALGRFAFGAVPGRLTGEDRAAVATAMAAVGCTALANRTVTSLSGGEQALACLARVLVADTPILLADEPVAALDPANQYRVMECLAQRAAARKTVVIVLHDLSLAAQFADSVIWMKDGAIVAQSAGSAKEFEQHVSDCFGRNPCFATDGSRALFFRREMAD